MFTVTAQRIFTVLVQQNRFRINYGIIANPDFATVVKFAKAGKLDTSVINRFHLALNNDKEPIRALISYDKINNVFNLKYAFVPRKYRGYGIGHILAEKAFDYIAERNFKMIITCTFLQRVYEKNRSKYEKYYVH